MSRRQPTGFYAGQLAFCRIALCSAQSVDMSNFFCVSVFLFSCRRAVYQLERNSLWHAMACPLPFSLPVSGLACSSWQSSKPGCTATGANSSLCRNTIQVEKVPGVSKRRTHAGFRQPLSHPVTLQHPASLPLTPL